MQVAMSSMESGSKYLRTFPEISGKQDVCETMVGVPQAMDSTIGSENPSYNDGTTANPAPLISNAKSVSETTPVRITFPLPCPPIAALKTSSLAQPICPASTRSISKD